MPTDGSENEGTLGVREGAAEGSARNGAPPHLAGTDQSPRGLQAAGPAGQTPGDMPPGEPPPQPPGIELDHELSDAIPVPIVSPTSLRPLLSGSSDGGEVTMEVELEAMSEDGGGEDVDELDLDEDSMRSESAPLSQSPPRAMTAPPASPPAPPRTTTITGRPPPAWALPPASASPASPSPASPSPASPSAASPPLSLPLSPFASPPPSPPPRRASTSMTAVAPLASIPPPPPPPPPFAPTAVAPLIPSLPPEREEVTEELSYVDAEMEVTREPTMPAAVDPADDPAVDVVAIDVDVDGAVPVATDGGRDDGTIEPSVVVEIPLESQLESPTVLDQALGDLVEAGGAERRAQALSAALEAATDRSLVGALAYELGEVCERRLADEARAVKAFGKALQSDPSLRPNLWAIRRVFYRRGLWPNLVKLIDAEIKFARDDRERADLLVEKALLLGDRLEQRVEARAALERALAFDGGSQPALYHLERLLHADGAIDPEALAAVWRAMVEAATDPRRKVVYLLDLIRYYGEQGDDGVERAQELVSSAVALGVDVERVAAERLRIAELAGDTDEMIAALEAQLAQLLAGFGPAGVPLPLEGAPRAPGQPPDRATALRLRMVALRRRQAQVARQLGDDPERAWSFLQQALALGPGEPLLLADLADLAEQLGRYDELAELVQGWEALEADPGRSLALSIRRADALLRGGQRDAARALLATLSSTAPGYLPITSLAERDALVSGDARALAEAWSASASAATLGTTFGPDVAPAPDPRAAAAAHVAAADVYAGVVGDDEAARVELGRALEAVPGDPSALEALVELHERAGRLDEAAALLELHDERAELWARRPRLEHLTELYRQQGDRDRQLAAERRLLALDPGDPRLQRQVVDSLAALGRDGERVVALTVLAEAEHEAARRAALWLEAARVADDAGLRDGAGGELAVALYRSVLEVATPGDATSRYARAALIEVLRRGARWDELVGERKAEAAELDDGPLLAVALRDAADVLERRLDRPADAAELLGVLLDRAPGDVAALIGLVRAGATAGPEREAVRARALAALEELAEGADEAAAQVAWLLRLGAAQESAARERGERPTDAIDTYRRVLTVDPASAMAAIALTELAIAGDDTAARLEALSALADSRADAGLRAAIFEQIGWLWALVLEDFDRAADAFASAIGADAGRQGALLGLALVAARRGESADVGGALARLAGAVASPAAAQAMLLRAAAIADCEGGDGSRRAEALVRAALAIAPDDPGTLVVAAEYLAPAALSRLPSGSGGEDDGEAETNRLLERADLFGTRAAFAASPAARDDWELDRAEALDAAGRLREAGRVVAGVLEGRPTHLRALDLLRRLCRRGGDRAGLARASLALARALGDSTAKLTLWREAVAIFDSELGDLTAAVPVYRRILLESPGAPEFERLINVFRGAGDVGGMIEIIGDRLNWLDPGEGGPEQSASRLAATAGERARRDSVTGGGERARRDSVSGGSDRIRRDSGVIADPRATIPLLLERARLRAAIGDGRGAARDLDALLARNGAIDARLAEALSRRAELALAAGDARLAAEHYQRYLQIAEESPRRGEVELVLARILAEDMNDVGGALAQLQAVVASSPSDVSLRERMIELATRAQDWPRVVREIREVARLRGSNGERARDELRAAAVLRDRSGDRAKARQALERARELDPLNLDAVRELAELLGTDDPSARAKVLAQAGGAVRGAIAGTPERAAFYERLAVIAQWQDDRDGRYYALAALDALGSLSAEQRQFVAGARGAIAAQAVPRSPLGDPRGAIAPAVAGGVAAAVWRVIGAAVAAIGGLEPGKLGFARTDKVAAKSLGKRFEPLAAALACFGTGELEVYVSESRTGVARAIAGEPPIVCLGADIAGAATPAARFLLGRALASSSDGIGVAAELRDEELLLDFAAAWRVAELPAGRDGPVSELLALGADPRLLEERARLLGKHLSRRRDRKALVALAEQADELGDPRQWRRGAVAYANRAGLLLAGDLAAGLDVLDVGRGGRSLVDSPVGLDLLAWAVGDAHLGLRRRLGLAPAVGAAAVGAAAMGTAAVGTGPTGAGPMGAGPGKGAR